MTDTDCPAPSFKCSYWRCVNRVERPYQRCDDCEKADYDDAIERAATRRERQEEQDERPPSVEETSADAFDE